MKAVFYLSGRSVGIDSAAEERVMMTYAQGSNILGLCPPFAVEKVITCMLKLIRLSCDRRWPVVYHTQPKP